MPENLDTAELLRVLRQLRQGDFSARMPLDWTGVPGKIADALNDVVDQQERLVEELVRVRKAVGTEGRLEARLNLGDARGGWAAAAEAVNGLVLDLARPTREAGRLFEALARGDLSQRMTTQLDGQPLRGEIARMIGSLHETIRLNQEQDWLKTNLTRFARMTQGLRDQRTVAKQLLSELAPLVHVEHGVFYVMEEEEEQQPGLKMLAAYAFNERKHLSQRILPGEGLVGQCVVEKERILLTEVPPDYVRIRSALGEAPPLHVVVLPILFEGHVQAVIELASFKPFVEIELNLLDQLAEGLGTALATIAATSRTEAALQESRVLTEELQQQQEELRETNLALEQQTTALRASEETLKQQQEELQHSNEELADKARLLREQKTQVEAQNREIEEAGQRLAEKADQLALTSKYKSEFLANMSHELRTPLNSLLILAQILGENRDENLSDEQLEQIRTIYSSGNDLLTLINEVLDLSKIEAGAMQIRPGVVLFTDVAAFAERSFRQVAVERGLEFTVTLAESLPLSLTSDETRLQQVLRNLLANAFKFTEQGRVELRVTPAPAGSVPGRRSLTAAAGVVAFVVRDTGIGVPDDQQMLIFEAFQQVDGSTSRPYGGTGLGLPISRQIAHLLGGEIVAQSVLGEGSVFTLYLPLDGPPAEADRYPEDGPAVQVRSGLPASARKASADAPIDDDRRTLANGDRVVVIVEDDLAFARVLLSQARQHGFKGVVADHGDDGLELVRTLRPDAVTLDLRLPDNSGWTVLDQLKHDPATRHIPVHVISVESERQRGLHLGAVSYLEKPVSKEDLDRTFAELEAFLDRDVRRLLVVEDDDVQRRAIVQLIGEADVETVAVATGKEALEHLADERFDCMVVDLKLPDMNGLTLIDKIRKDPQLGSLPIVVYTAKELSRREETRLRKLAEAVVVKGVRSPERLLDETALFLHRVETALPESKQRVLQRAAERDVNLAGRKILVIDDDVRNVFAITAALEGQEMEVVFAENGQEGLQALQENPDIDAVLMDVMMPAMDGYEATRAIRAQKRFARLPIIALTAKAMPGDRQKCIEAGASDYIAKPVDLDQLLSLLRVWLYQPQG